MKLKMKVKGLKGLLRSTRQQSLKQGQAIQRGLKRGGLIIQRASQKIVPIDTAALKNSASTRSDKKGHETVVTVSYNVSYAVWVHEDLEARHKKGKTAKFLEIAVRENWPKIKRDLKKESRRIAREGRRTRRRM